MSHKNKDGLFKQVYDRLQGMNGQGGNDNCKPKSGA